MVDLTKWAQQGGTQAGLSRVNHSHGRGLHGPSKLTYVALFLFCTCCWTCVAFFNSNDHEDSETGELKKGDPQAALEMWVCGMCCTVVFVYAAYLFAVYTSANEYSGFKRKCTIKLEKDLVSGLIGPDGPEMARCVGNERKLLRARRMAEAAARRQAEALYEQKKTNRLLAANLVSRPRTSYHRKRRPRGPPRSVRPTMFGSIFDLF